MLLELLKFAILIILAVIIWQAFKKPSNYPPGPWGFPLIGSIPLGLEGFFNGLHGLRKKYSDIISWRIGTKLVVVLFDYDLVKEVYSNPAFENRPNLKTLTYLQGDEILGIISNVGARWRTNRRFALRHLRDFGMGKSKLLSVAHYEAENLINELKNHVGKPSPVPHFLVISVLNIVWQMVGSKRYDYDDEEVNYFCKLVSETQIYSSKLIILDIFPWLKRVLPQVILNLFFKFNIQLELSNKIKKYFKKRIDEHLEDLDANNPRDYIDAYLIEMKKQESDPDSTLSVEDLIFCVSDLFEGATESTDLSIHWAILYLCKFPHVQARLQKEIDEFLPKGTSYSVEDKLRLPYTEAFIHELLRYSSVIPEPPREAVIDTKIGEYFIPKETLVILQGFMIHFDSRYFESPQEFRPERFLDSNGIFSAPKEGFVPFGYGKRICIGETIARMELFVFITKLVQNFRFEFPPGEDFNLEGVVSPFFRPPKGSPNVIMNLR